MPEALEKWPVQPVRAICCRATWRSSTRSTGRFLSDVSARFPNDYDASARMSLIEDGHERQVRMAHLAVVGSFSVNGVAELHSELLKERVFHDFLSCGRRSSTTRPTASPRGASCAMSNPRLSALVTARIGDGWLQRPRPASPSWSRTPTTPLSAPSGGQSRQRTRLIWPGHRQRGPASPSTPNSMYDVMVKRLHEYKRQLMKALHIITLYNRLKRRPVARHRPAHLHLRRQGGARLLHGQADHQADQLHRRDGQRRPGGRPAEGRLFAQLQRDAGRDHLSRRPICRSRSRWPARRRRARAT
jgi:starch phosphorylase